MGRPKFAEIAFEAELKPDSGCNRLRPLPDLVVPRQGAKCPRAEVVQYEILGYGKPRSSKLIR